MRFKKSLILAAALVVIVLGIVPLRGLLAGQQSLASTLPGAKPAVTPTARVAATTEATAVAVAPTPMPASSSTATPLPTPTVAPSKSLLEGRTWLTLYGRGWDIGPILGRLGFYKNADEMAAEVGPWTRAIKKVNGGKEVVPVMHLIYGMAIPCEADGNCLLYLDTAGEDIVNDYIKPAQARGWQVILDSQVGKSNPVAEVQRMIKKGYLDYPNVHVALDPEFHVHPGEDLPGIPIGQLDAADLNQAQHLLDDLVKEKGLPKKVFMVHQFGDPMVNDGNPFMITNKKSLETLSGVDLVIDADGFGGPASKVKKYDQMTDTTAYPFLKFRGIKLFFHNPYEERHHYDKPAMSWEQVFGLEPVGDGLKMTTPPDVVVVA
ncbi:MAG: hypothetical protein ACYC3S_07740 [Chloroflexota bacterium]